MTAVEEQLVTVLGLNRKPVSCKRLDAILGEDGIKSLVESSPDPERQRRELTDQLTRVHCETYSLSTRDWGRSESFFSGRLRHDKKTRRAAGPSRNVRVWDWTGSTS